MKTSLTISKGIIAVLVLGSVSCMNKGFQPLQGSSSNSDQQVTPNLGRWTSLPDGSGDIEGENNEAENNEVENKPVPETKKAPQPAEKSAKVQDQEKVADVKIDKTARNNPANDNKADFTGPGVLKPTIYYFVTFDEDKSQCKKDTMMHAAGGKDLLMVCEKTAKECGQQGSCAVIQNGVTRSFNVLGAKDGQDRFFEIGKEGCRFGYGVDNACLDPFYTLAADLSLYDAGEVIYVPGIVGMDLPDGSKHSGYFVIRDRGRGVTGTGRFDFFSGMVAWKDSKNPFTKMGLGDVKTNIPYFKVKGKTAQQVLLHRAFPKLPKK